MRWVIKPFEDCIEPIQYSKKILRKDFLGAGDFPIVSQEAELINGFWNKKIDLFKVTTPVIIFGDHTQVLKYVDFDFVLGADGVKILKPCSFLNPKFFFYWLKSFDLPLLGYARHYRLLKELNLKYPVLSEQGRTVAILDETFAGIAKAKENVEKNLRNSREVFESYLEGVFLKPGKGWVRGTLSDVLAVQPQNGWSPPAVHHSSFGVPVLTLSSVTGFTFKEKKRKYTSAPTNPQRHYWVKNGDFLITRSNTPELVGHVAIVSGIVEPTIYPDLIMRMNASQDRMITKFLYYQMRTFSLRAEIMGRAQGANPTMKKISKSAVQSLPIIIPSIENQCLIVAKLDMLSEQTKKLEGIYKRKIQLLDELKKSVLKKAFSGEL